MKNYQVLFFLSSLFGLFTACKNDHKVVSSSYENQYFVVDRAADIPFTITMPVDFNPSTELDDVEMLYFQSGYRQLQDETKDWKVLDPKYRSLLETYQNNKYINCLKQVLAQDILINKALINANPKEAINVIEFYTNQLRSSGSTNTVLLYNCVLKLSSTWNKKAIKELATSILNSYTSLKERQRSLRKGYDEEVETERNLNPQSPKIKLYDKLNKHFGNIEKKQAEYALKLQEVI